MLYKKKMLSEATLLWIMITQNFSTYYVFVNVELKFFQKTF